MTDGELAAHVNMVDTTTVKTNILQAMCPNISGRSARLWTRFPGVSVGI